MILACHRLRARIGFSQALRLRSRFFAVSGLIPKAVAAPGLTLTPCA
jgi:hypothetical protein